MFIPTTMIRKSFSRLILKIWLHYSHIFFFFQQHPSHDLATGPVCSPDKSSRTRMDGWMDGLAKNCAHVQTITGLIVIKVSLIYPEILMCRKTQQIKVKKFTLSQNSSVSQCEHTLEIKAPASKMALMCLSQPEFSRPHRKSLMDGDLISPTARERASDKKEEEKETQRGDQIDTLAVTPPHPNTHSTTYHRWFSAGCSSSRECSQCRWRAAWCWCNSPRSHSLYLLLDLPWHLAIYEIIITAHNCTIYHANNPEDEEGYLGSGVHHVDVITARVGLH